MKRSSKTIASASPFPAHIAVQREDLLSLRPAARGLSLKPCQRGKSLLSGQHLSRLRGRGMDYLESRHYQAGDDVRNFDWRVTARTNQPHIKLFVEEREQPVVMLVNLSASMSIASQGAFKSVIAARTASLFGWIAAAQGDRVGGMIYRSDTQHEELKPQGGRRGILQLIEALVNLGQPHTEFDSQQAGLPEIVLQRVQRMAKPGTQIFVISDFFQPNEHMQQLMSHLAQLRQHNNVLGIQVVDPLELFAPPSGDYGVSDGQQSWRMKLEGSTQREKLNTELQQRQQQLESNFQQIGIPLLRMMTSDDVAAILHQVLSNNPGSCTGNLLMPKEALV